MSDIADFSAGRICLRITGADAATFLHGQCTNDIQRLPVGGDCYAAFLNVKGKMRGDGHILRLPEAFVIEVAAELKESLEKFVITEDVVIEPCPMYHYLILGEPVGDGLRYRCPLGTGWLTTATLPVTMPAAELEKLRLEAGVPAWRVDMDENTIPVEAGLGSAISYDKGCYVGQETIARIRTYGHVNRHLCQLQVASADVPRAGEPLRANGRPVGQVTSAVCSNRLGKVVALGYVRREFANPGTQLTAGGWPAEVWKQCAV
jgi:folate-binding protein YgfZ